jgi:monoamine oxidase
MAIPPTLQTRIEYSPPLPALRDQLLQHFPMAHCIKTVTTFKSKWWRDLGMAGFFASVNSGKPLTSGFDGTNTHSLVGFIMANNARYWSTKTKQERTEAVLQQYAEMFGRDIEFVKDQFVHFMEQNWANEEFSRGCYEGYTTPGGKYDTIFTNTVALTNYGEAFREPIGNMYFAGTEAAKYWTGYMSGAIDAGERAADDIINDMNGKLRTGPVVRKRSPKKSYVTPVIVALLSMVTFSVIMVLRNK